MPTIYQKTSLTNNGADIYNAVITSTPSLNGILPAAVTENGGNSREIGELLYNTIDLSNSFITSLLNRIALTVVQSKVWEDPWMSLEKGKLNYGEVIQEVFVKMAKPHGYNPERAEQEVFKREIPDVMTAFHGVNYKKFYKQTIQNEDLRMAFLSWDAFTKFVADIISNMFTSQYYDQFQAKKYLIAQAILNGGLKAVQIPEATAENAKAITATARGISSRLTFMSTEYNAFGVPNFAKREDQVIIINAMYEGTMDVEVLAASFNMDKAEFLAMNRLIVDSFGSLDTERLSLLFANDSSYQEISQEDMALLDNIPFIIVDRSIFQIYDYFNGVTNIYNPEGLYWNYDLHIWKALGLSPFANGVVFTPVAPTVTRVSVNPSAVTITKGQTGKLEANVETTGFANKAVTWSSSNAKVTVSKSGVVSVASDATGTATITATSVFDTSKRGTSTVTVG